MFPRLEVQKGSMKGNRAITYFCVDLRNGRKDGKGNRCLKSEDGNSSLKWKRDEGS